MRFKNTLECISESIDVLTGCVRTTTHRRMRATSNSPYCHVVMPLRHARHCAAWSSTESSPDAGLPCPYTRLLCYQPVKSANIGIAVAGTRAPKAAKSGTTSWHFPLAWLVCAGSQMTSHKKSSPIKPLRPRHRRAARLAMPCSSPFQRGVHVHMPASAGTVKSDKSGHLPTCRTVR